MKLKLFKGTHSLKARFFVAFIILSIVVYTVAISLSYRGYNTFINQNIYHFYSVQSKSFAILISSKIEKAQIRTSNMVKYLNQYQLWEEDKRRDIYKNYLKTTLKDNKNDFGVFTIWKQYTIDNLDKEYQNSTNNFSGQFGVWYVKDLKNIKEVPITINEIDLLNRYTSLFSNVFNKFMVIAPIKFSSDVILDTVNVVRVVMPIRDSKTGFILGIGGIDMKIENLVGEFPTDVLSTLMITNEKMELVYHANKNFIGKKLTTIYPRLQTQTEIIHNLNTGVPTASSGNFFNENKKDLLVSYPISVGPYVWNIILRVPQSEVTSRTRRIMFINTLILAGVLLTFLMLFLFFQSSLFRRLRQMSEDIEQLARGEISDQEVRDIKIRELLSLKNSLAKIKDKFNKYAHFTEQLAEGKFQNLSLELESEKDILGKSLLKLQQTLIENERQNIEIQKRQEIENWHNSGIAKFNEIIRKNINDLESLSYEVIKELAEYVDAVVGGFFYLRHNPESEDYLELTGFYAYSRKIYHKKKIDLGEGLIGNVALEKKAIHMNVPPNYLEIISGMGKAKPEYLVIQPMISTDTVYGILELAKLNEFKEHEITFIAEVSSIVASSLAASRITEETRRLLEESQKVAEEMKQKEETLKKSLLELQEIKNKSEEQRKHLQSIVSALNEILYYVEFSPKLKVISINDLFLNKLKYSYAEAASSNYFELLNVPVEDIDKHKQYWTRLKRSEIVKFDYKIELKNETIWIKAVLVPITKDYELERVIFIGLDYTEVKKKEDEVNMMLVDLNEKEERLNVQEQELEMALTELNNLYNEVEEKNIKITNLEEKLKKLQASYEMLQKEFEKRLKRSRKIESSLKERIKFLENKLRELGYDDEDLNQ